MTTKPETTKTVQDMTRPLYDLSHDFALIVDHLEECGGEMTEENLGLWNGIQGAVSEKLESCAIMIQALTGRSAAIKAEAKRLTDRAKVASNRADHLKRYTFEHMTRMDIKKNEGDIVSLRVQKNPATCEVTDAEMVPAELVTVTVKMSGEDWEELKYIMAEEDTGNMVDEWPVTKTPDKKAIIKLWNESHESEQTPGTVVSKSKSLRLY